MALSNRLLVLYCLAFLAPLSALAVTQEELDLEAAILASLQFQHPDPSGASSSSSSFSSANQACIAATTGSSSMQGATFAKNVRDKLKLIRTHEEVSFILEEPLQVIERLLVENPFHSFQISPQEGEGILNDLTLLNGGKLSNEDSIKVFLAAKALQELVRSQTILKEKDQWTTFGRALYPQVEPYLQRISAQLFHHLSHNEEGAVPYSPKKENDPNFGIEDVLQNAIAGAVNASEAQLKAAYKAEEAARNAIEAQLAAQYKKKEKVIKISIPFPPQNTLENRWTARQRVAYDTFLDQLATGKFLKAKVWEAKDAANIVSADAVIPSAPLQSVLDQWLAESSLQFKGTQLALQREAERKHAQQLEAQHLAQAQEEVLKQAQVAQQENALRNEVTSLLNASSIPANLSLHQATELLRQQYAQIQGVNLHESSSTPAAPSKVQRITKMSVKDLIKLTKGARLGQK